MKYLKFVFIVMTLTLLQCKNGADDIVPVNVSILDVSITEGNIYTNLTIQLELDAAADQQIVANISTSNGTAELAKDYIPIVNRPVIFAAGETVKTSEITIAGDLILEEDENFQVTIASVEGPVTIDKATATVDIINDDVTGIQEIEVCPTLDWTAVASLPVWSEAPYEICNFGQPINVPNAEYTSVGALDDTIFFRPKINAAGDTLLYRGIYFEDGFNSAAYVDLINDLVSPTDSVSTKVTMPIINNDISDIEFKYDIHIMIGTAQGRVGPYTIDPKIRIAKSQ